MCRFLMAKSASPISPAFLLEDFADMAEKSRAPDGDRKADGWGAAWLDESGAWRSRTSTIPIWNDRPTFASIPMSRILLVHARSASFPGQKGVPAYNQPFVSESRAFVFNGLLHGVSLPRPVPGDIGAQKIWALLREREASTSAESALTGVTGLLERHCRRLQGLNVGVCDKKNLYAFCRFEGDGTYYQLYVHEAPGLSLVCSEPLPDLDFHPLLRNTVLTI